MSSQEIWDTPEYIEAVEMIRHRLKNKINEDYDLIYDAFEQDEKGIPIDNLDQVAVKGTVIVEDDIHEKYVGNPIENPTWADLVREGIQQMKTNGDYHHLFFTGFYEIDAEPTTPLRIALDFES